MYILKIRDTFVTKESTDYGSRFFLTEDKSKAMRFTSEEQLKDVLKQTGYTHHSAAVIIKEC